MQLSKLAFLAGLSSLALFPGASPAAVFTIQEVPGAAGDLRVNDHGQIAGISLDSYSPALWDAQLNRIVLISGSNYSTVTGLNNLGQVVGGTSTGPTFVPYFWSAFTGVVSPLADFGGGYGMSRAINDLGQVVGYSQDTSRPNTRFRGFAWSAGTGGVELLPGRTDLRHVLPNALNNGGTIVGSFVSEALSCCSQAFALSPDGTFRVIGGVYSTTNAINEAGDIAGSDYSGTHEARVFRHDGTVVGLGNIGGTFSVALDINENGEAVGEATTATGATRAFYWSQATGMVELPSLGGTYAHAISISNTGLIGGMSADASGVGHGVVWRLLTSPADLVDSLGDTVEGLLSGGTLTAQEAGSLGSNLDQAALLIQGGKLAAASNILGAFQNKVGALVNSGRLTAAQGQSLLEAAEQARAGIQ